MAAGRVTALASELMSESRDELARKAASATLRLKDFVEKSKAPLTQLAHTGSGWVGGIGSGVIRTWLPELWGIPVDGTIGVVTSLLCAFGAGNPLVDAVAEFGVGLAAPAFSRGTEGILRTWLAAPNKQQAKAA